MRLPRPPIRVPAPLHRHAAKTQVDTRQLARTGAQHVRARRCVIGDRVGDANIPVGDAAADNFKCRQRVLDGTEHIHVAWIAYHDIATDDECDFGFDFRLGKDFSRNGFAVAVAHVIKQHAEVRLIDPELLLHRHGGQADLATNEAPTIRQMLVRVDPLNRIRVGDAQLLVCLAQRRDVFACLCRVTQRGRRLLNSHGFHGPLSCQCLIEDLLERGTRVLGAKQRFADEEMLHAC